ncbi:MAG: twin-arginine translocase TatA/TatE family subunit [Bdellovibrionota bacterium]
MFGLSPLELSIVALLVVLLFGTRRLPELGSGLGKAISNFKKSYKDEQALDVTPDAKDASGSSKSGDDDADDKS